MDRRTSWPWKKKSSEKLTEKKVVASGSVVASLDSTGSQGYQKKTNYVRISTESYEHLSGLDNQVKTLNDQMKLLNEKLSSAHSEITIKDDLVNQHVRVAEEAVSGWEKAEAEALALKHQLESVTLLKLTVEERASHLDGALKDCTRQLRDLKEEHEQKLHEVVLAQTNKCDKIKLELEAKIADLEQGLRRSSAENSALSRTLQESSDMLMKISEEKSQAVAEIEHLKSNIQLHEREISSLNYELHIVSKELEIRNEEKDMNMKSAEVANKQHIEGVKKIAKLEKECQRLRNLVRKKLPGPAALAQMKVEVENMGWDHGETQIRWSPVKNANPHSASLPEFSLANIQQCARDNKFLMERMLAMEDETNMLKEALTKRNSELEALRTLCAKTASKVQSFKPQMQALNQQKSSEDQNVEFLVEGSHTHIPSCPSSVASMSEDGIDGGQSSAESRAMSLISELSHSKKERNINKANKAGCKNHMELMDDFLEMERFACLSNESDGAVSILDSPPDKRTENEDHKSLVDVENGGYLSTEKESFFDSSKKYISPNERLSARKLESDMDEVALSELQSRISTIFKSGAKDVDVGKVLQDIKHLVLDIQDSLPQHSVSCVSVETHSLDATSNQKADCPDNMVTVESGTSLILDRKPRQPLIDQKFATAVFQIHDFVKSLGKEAFSILDESPDGYGIGHRIQEFSNSVDEVMCRKMSVVDFVLNLSRVLVKASELSFNVLGYKSKERETCSSDCIDKGTLLENEEVQDDPFRKRFPNGCGDVSHSTSDIEVIRKRCSSLGYESKDASWKCLLEELERLQSEKDNMEMHLARCTENLESTKFQLQQSEQLIQELKSQLASSKKYNSLTETQLKCMVESYKSLEKREQELEAEVNFLRGKTQTLDNELQEEKQSRQDALDKCKDIQEQIQRKASCSMCSQAPALTVDSKSKQEREILSASEKLAECQETIFLLDRQLKALRPPIELVGSPYNESPQTSEASVNYGHSDMEIITSANMPKERGKSPSDVFNTPSSLSDTEADIILRSIASSKSPKLTHTKSSSSYTSSVVTPEKYGHGLSRFFASKPRSGQ